MQCPSCRFENMPGLDSCGRCGTSLGVGTATIDVNPPRASRTTKRMRKVVPRRLIYQARDLASDARRRISGSIVQDSRVPLPEPAILSRLILPGWAHIHSGLRIRGRFWLGMYLALLLLGLIQWGTYTGSILLGLAFSVHASSAMDILMRQGTVRFPRMMAMAAFVSLALAVLIYVPTGQLLTRIAAPVEFATDSAPFERFDVVLYNQWAYSLTGPRRGDVVLFQPTNLSRLAGGLQIPGYRFTWEENQLIDRLVGLPGDRVVWDRDDGRLSVNGNAVAWKPLLFERLPKHLEITVPSDRYLILATTSAGALRAGVGDSFWKLAGAVPRSDILGGVYLRISPLWRLWFIR